MCPMLEVRIIVIKEGKDAADHESRCSTQHTLSTIRLGSQVVFSSLTHQITIFPTFNYYFVLLA